MKRSRPRGPIAMRDVTPTSRARVTRANVAVVALAAAAVVAALSAGVTMGEGRPDAPRAVLVDQLGRTDPGTDFRTDVANVLRSAGYHLDVVPPEAATVRRMQSLPESQAQLVILRMHSALIVDGGRWTDDVALFTSDPVDLGEFAVTGLDGGGAAGGTAAGGTAAHTIDAGGVSPAALTPPVDAFSPDELAALVPVRRSVGDDRRPYFGLGPAFVRDHLRGTFRSDAIIVLMGCDSLRGRAMSEAFLGRGARAAIGWSDQVSAAHTDKATSLLVADLAAGRTVTEAIRRTMLAVGRDPVSGAYLIAAVRD